MKLKLSHQKMLVNKLLLIDGVGRTGKTLLSKILPTLQNFEQVEFTDFLEQTLAGVNLNKVSLDYSESFIISTFNELFYNKLLGRKLNFRPTDITSVANFNNKKIYEQRLKIPEGNNIIRKIKRNKNFFPFMTHDVMANHHLVEKMNLNYKMIEIYRNPFDVAYSWYKQGWGFRFDKDPRSSTLSTKYYGTLIPWYVFNYKKKWLKMNNVERCASIVLKLIEQTIKNHKKIKKKGKIYTLSYEKFIENSEDEISKICKFLKTKKTTFTKTKLIEEKCPNIIDINKQDEKRKFIKSNISSKMYKRLYTLTKNYEKNFYNL